MLEAAEEPLGAAITDRRVEYLAVALAPPRQ